MIGIFYVVLAAILDVVANLLLKKSNGFKNKVFGVLALFIVMGAFVALSFAIKTIPLSVAYASWGTLGIVGTFLGGYFLFNERLSKIGFLGIFCILLGILFLHADAVLA